MEFHSGFKQTIFHQRFIHYLPDLADATATLSTTTGLETQLPEAFGTVVNGPPDGGICNRMTNTNIHVRIVPL